jgi:hypothetical protein
MEATRTGCLTIVAIFESSAVIAGLVRWWLQETRNQGHTGYYSRLAAFLAK